MYACGVLQTEREQDAEFRILPEAHFTAKFVVYSTTLCGSQSRQRRFSFP